MLRSSDELDQRWVGSLGPRSRHSEHVEQSLYRLVELGERERPKNYIASRALFARDSYGGLEGFRGRRVRRAMLQQHLAADSMQFGVECAMANPVGCRQSFVEDREGAGDIACAGLRFGERNLNGYQSSAMDLNSIITLSSAEPQQPTTDKVSTGRSGHAPRGHRVEPELSVSQSRGEVALNVECVEDGGRGKKEIAAPILGS